MNEHTFGKNNPDLSGTYEGTAGPLAGLIYELLVDCPHGVSYFPGILDISSIKKSAIFSDVFPVNILLIMS